MALTKCPNCGRTISNVAMLCSYCRYPIRPVNKKMVNPGKIIYKDSDKLSSSDSKQVFHIPSITSPYDDVIPIFLCNKCGCHIPTNKRRCPSCAIQNDTSRIIWYVCVIAGFVSLWFPFAGTKGDKTSDVAIFKFSASNGAVLLLVPAVMSLILILYSLVIEHTKFTVIGAIGMAGFLIAFYTRLSNINFQAERSAEGFVEAKAGYYIFFWAWIGVVIGIIIDGIARDNKKRNRRSV